MKIHNTMKRFSEVTNDSKLQNRLKLSVLAICMMWATSLRVAVFLSSLFISVPTFSQVKYSINNGLAVVAGEKEAYVKCVNSQLTKCKRNLEQKIIGEVLADNRTARLNAQLTDNAQGIQRRCYSSYSSLQRSLETYISTGGSLIYKETCKDDVKDKLSVLVGDVNSAKSEAFDIATSFSDSSSGTVDRLVSYSKERANYDLMYIQNQTEKINVDLSAFLGDITVPTHDMDVSFLNMNNDVENLISCLSLRNSEERKCISDNTARRSMDIIIYSLKNRIDDLTEEWDAFSNGVSEYKQNAIEAYQNALTYYHGSQSFVSTMKSVVAIFDNNWLSDWYDIPPESFLTVEVPFPENIPTFQPLPSVDDIWIDLTPMLNKFYANFTTVQANLQNKSNELRKSVGEQLNSIPDFTPQDYNPPQYVGANSSEINLEEERLTHLQESEQFLQQSATILDTFGKLSKSSFDSNETTSPTKIYNFSLDLNPDSVFNIRAENFSRPRFDVSILLLEFSNVGDLMFFIDFIIRVYFSARIIYKYWDVSSIRTPLIDIRTNKKTVNPLEMSPFQTICCLVFNKKSGLLVISFLFVWMMSLLYGAYSPLYIDFYRGCVKNSENGTFVTNNIYSIAYNFAARDGSSAGLNGLRELNRRRREICSTQRTSSIRSLQENEVKLSSLKNLHNETREIIGDYRMCLDVENMDSIFGQLCCEYELFNSTCSNISSNYSGECPLDDFASPIAPFDIPSSYMNTTACEESISGDSWILDESIFNCSNLPSCSMTCNGPNESLLKRFSLESGCMVEWYFHSFWLHGALALMVFIIVNVSRLAFISGLTRVFWHYLHPNQLTFQSSCRTDGTIEFTSDTDKASFELGEILRDRASMIVYKFRVVGYCLIFGAIIVLIPMIYILTKMNNNSTPFFITEAS